eukprot:229469_1
MGAFCASCCCMQCIMDSYLHLRIRDITKTNWQAGGISDKSAFGGPDISVRIIYQGYIQDTKMINNDLKSVVLNEPIIIENGRPSPHDTLRLQIFDVDQYSSDDLLGEVVVPLPEAYGEDIGEQRCDVTYNGQVVAQISIDQIHFIKQKVRRYQGPCKCLCCCLEVGLDADTQYGHYQEPLLEIKS